MRELKRCPFCGGEIKLYEYDFYMFCCDECGAEATFAKSLEDGTAEECTKEESIEKWNTRKPMDRIVERLEAIKEYAWDEEYQTVCDIIEIVKEEGGLNET